MQNTERFTYSKRKNGSIRIQTKILEPSQTDQSFASECDINEIVRKFTKTSVWPGDPNVYTYSDQSLTPDLHTAMNSIAQANSLINESFQGLTYEQQAHFNHNAHDYIKFINDPGNYDQVIKLGLVPKPKPPEPEPAPIKVLVTNEPLKT